MEKLKEDQNGSQLWFWETCSGPNSFVKFVYYW